MVTPNNGGKIASLVGRVLAYMDAPWKAAVIVILIVLCGVGFALWQEREFFREALLRPQTRVYSMNNDAGDKLPRLFNETTADLLVLWSVHLEDNSVEFIRAVNRDGTAWAFSPRVLPAFSPTTPAVLFAAMLAGSGACEDITAREVLTGGLLERLKADGYKFVCYEPIPPSSGYGLIGTIAMVWKVSPSLIVSHGALAAAGRLALKMVK